MWYDEYEVEDMFKTFDEDRVFLENKYHKTDEPFDPYRRMAYHGYDYPAKTGETDEGILAGLDALSVTTASEPHAIAKAKAIAYVLEHTRIDVNEKDYFIGLYSMNRLIAKTTVDAWRNELFSGTLAKEAAAIRELGEGGTATVWPDYDHVVPDFRSILSLGFPGLLQRVKHYRKLHEENGTLTEEMRAHFDAMILQYEAIIAFIRRLYRYAEEHPTKKSPRVNPCLRHLTEGAPQDFYEALQILYIYFMISESVDNFQVRSMGNGLDRSLLPFYEADLASGRYTKEELKEFLAYFFMQFSALGNYWGQPFYLGGTNPDGTSRVNALSYDILEVYYALNVYNPKIQIKVSRNTPRDFLDIVFRNVRKAKGNVVFCCEPGYVRAVMNYGATYEEALDMDIRGCYETGVRANEVSTATAYLNAAKPVLYAINNGVDERTGKLVGIRTGEAETLLTFKDFYAAVLAQWSHLIERTVETVNGFEAYLSVINPSSMYSATIEGSMEKGVDAYGGGVKFNNSVILNCGFASMVDAILAVKEFVYEKEELTLAELKTALAGNWAGYERLRMKIRKSPHKYGNGDPLADRYAEALSTWYCSRVNNRPNARGGVYKALLHSAMQFVWQGEKTGATPDGRLLGEELSKNGSPSVGMDKNGVTALINSMLAIHPHLYSEAACLDVMLHPSAVEGEKGLDVMYALLCRYMDGYGMSIQFNVFSVDMLKEAQEHPEKYPDLQVRICGWNALWNNVCRKQQDAYICRAGNIQK